MPVGEDIFINARIIHGYEPKCGVVVPNIVLSSELVAGAINLCINVEPFVGLGISYLKL